MKRLGCAMVAAIVLAGLSSVACTGDDTVVNNSTNLPGLTVSGTGKVGGAPNVVFLQLGVNVENATVAGARELAAQAMQGVIDSIKANGVEDKNIQTTRFTVQPQYDYRDGMQTLRSYRVTNVVTAKVTPVEIANRVIDDAARAGGNSATIQSISFSIEDPTALQAQARELAVLQAKDRAEQLAHHAGVRLGAPISINESYQNVVPQAQAAPVLAPRTGDASTPIQAGELEVVVNVTFLYAIESR